MLAYTYDVDNCLFYSIFYVLHHSLISFAKTKHHEPFKSTVIVEHIKVNYVNELTHVVLVHDLHSGAFNEHECLKKGDCQVNHIVC